MVSCEASLPHLVFLASSLCRSRCRSASPSHARHRSMSPRYFSMTSEGWKAEALEAGREAARGAPLLPEEEEEAPLGRPAASLMWLSTE